MDSIEKPDTPAPAIADHDPDLLARVEPQPRDADGAPIPTPDTTAPADTEAPDALTVQPEPAIVEPDPDPAFTPIAPFVQFIEPEPIPYPDGYGAGRKAE